MILFADLNSDSVAAKSAPSQSSGGGECLSSELCSNRGIAKLGDLLWYQGDKQLCSIYPQVRIIKELWFLVH